MEADKQIEKLHDELREIIDPDDYGWINKSTEVVIDDLIMAGVGVEKTEKCVIINDLRIKFAMHFGTYTNNDVVKVADVFGLLREFSEGK